MIFRLRRYAMATALCPASMLRLHGADATAFAHAQFTTDVRELASGRCGWSAWLDAQGRVRAVFALLRIDADTLFMWAPLADAAALAADLSRFMLRSRVRVEAVEGWQVFELGEDDIPAASDGAPRTDGYALRLPGAHARGIALAPGHATVDAPAFDAWQRANIADRLPWIGPASTGRYVPQAMELERIGAIRFDKGCYPGQEIAARLHFRGGNKRGLRVVEAGEGHVEDGAGLIDASGALAGHVLYGVAAENGRPAEALAVVNLDAGAVRPAPSPLQGDPEARPDLAGFGYLVESPSKLRLTLA
jgi:folate-binding protein YgfZ